MDDQNNIPANNVTPLLRKSAKLSWAERVQARLTLSEATEQVGRMMTAYSDGRELPRPYIGALADSLMQWPREVAVAACSPVHGVPKEQKNFRPTTGQIMEWCEREAAFFYRMAEREGLLLADSHKTYTGTSNLFNKIANPYGTLLHDRTNDVAHNKESVFPQQKYTTEERCAHVERLRAQGRLTFDTETSREEQEARKKQAARIDLANEKIQAGWERYASASVGIKISPSLLALGPEMKARIEAPELAAVPF
jgi:hypothetical protein